MRALGEVRSGEEVLEASHARGVEGAVEGQTGALQAVAAVVVIEGDGILRSVLVRLAERKVQVQAVGVPGRGVGYPTLHRGEVRGREAESFEVRQAPVGLAQRGFPREAAPIGGDAVVAPSRGLQHMAVAQPDFRIARIFEQQPVVDRAGALDLADMTQEHGMEVPIAGVHRVCGEQPLDLCEGLSRLVVAMQQHRTRVAGRLEIGRKFQATVEQVSCRSVLPAAHRDLGQHADRRHVGRYLPEVVFQQPLGAWHVVGQHRCGRLPQRWVVRSALHVPGVGSIGFCRLTDRHQMIGEHAPGLGVGRLEAQQFPQRLDGRLALAVERERQGAFVPRR